ncbi:TPA: hypothetical protein ACH3X1_007857 [Trebouxia sp. C0004]
MNELSSAFPVSGGLYFWSFMPAGKYGPGAVRQVAGAFVIAVTLLLVAEKRQKWSWFLTDFEDAVLA